MRLTNDTDEPMSDTLRLVLDLDQHLAVIERRLIAEALGRKSTPAKILYLKIASTTGALIRPE